MSAICDFKIALDFGSRPAYRQMTSLAYRNDFSVFLNVQLTCVVRSWLHERATVGQLAKKLPAFYGALNFITVFTEGHHLSLSWATSIQSTLPHPTSWRFIIILYFHLRVGLASGLFPPGFSTKTLIRATCHVHLIVLDLISRIIFAEQRRTWGSPLCSLLLLSPSVQLSSS